MMMIIVWEMIITVMKSTIKRKKDYSTPISINHSKYLSSLKKRIPDWKIPIKIVIIVIVIDFPRNLYAKIVITK